jgi:hypothetical protein
MTVFWFILWAMYFRIIIDLYFHITRNEIPVLCESEQENTYILEFLMFNGLTSFVCVGCNTFLSMFIEDSRLLVTLEIVSVGILSIMLVSFKLLVFRTDECSYKLHTILNFLATFVAFIMVVSLVTFYIRIRLLDVEEEEEEEEEELDTTLKEPLLL